MSDIPESTIPRISSIQFKRGTKLALERVLRGLNKPKAGEPLFETDTYNFKIGDGINDYIDLPYTQEFSELVIPGYYYANAFWEDPTHLVVLPRKVNKLYFDIAGNEVYYYGTDTLFHKIVGLAVVGGGKPGLTKLYNSYGGNVDGTMTQAFLTQELNKKVEMSLDETGDECIILNSPNLLN